MSGLVKGQHRVTRSWDVICLIGTAVGGGCLAIMMLLTNVEILARQLLGESILISDEIGAYALLGLTFFGLSYTLKVRGHINVTLLIGRLGHRANKILNAATHLIGLFALALMHYAVWYITLLNLTEGNLSRTLLHTPLWIPMMGMPIGLTMMTIGYVMETVDGFKALRQSKGEREGVFT